MPSIKPKKIETIRHSYAHILAAAVLELFPKAEMGVGPAIENGFYHDFDLKKDSISSEDLPKIEEMMRKIIAKGDTFERMEVDIDKAIKESKALKYRTELIKELKKQGEKKVSFYQTGSFVNLCKGSHIHSAKELKTGAFKLIKTAGAYWRGDEKNPMLTRIYGVAFENKEELEKHLAIMEEAEKRDHRKLGKELFLIDSEVGLGLPLWLPKGALLWRIIEDFWHQEHLKNGYQLVRTPHIGSRQLWEKSGHWNFYNESMYPPMEVGRSLREAQKNEKSKISEEYLIKPMNCPFHVLLYKSQPRSYRNLPIRWAECGTVYRYEKSGELSGLIRARGFTQDDAHIVCSQKQVEEEIKQVIDFIIFMLGAFGFKDYGIYLSVRDPENKKKYAGNDEGWNFTEKILEKTAQEKKLNYVKKEGEAAFYGPKLDFMIKDALGREWQCSTLQFDFNLPERFKMAFTNEKGKDERPYMLHRALFGSFERFIALLIEHYAAAFPVWLSPEQVHILPISQKHAVFARKVLEQMSGIRAVLKDENETLSKKIRQSEQEKIPYLLIIGDKEIESQSVSVRQRNKGDLGQMLIPNFIEKIKQEIKERK